MIHRARGSCYTGFPVVLAGWRVAQAFDLVGITDAGGAPSFANCAKGGTAGEVMSVFLQEHNVMTVESVRFCHDS